jgi:hypothetical protein
MEVHHHSHSSPATGGTQRKKWTHYFWEFLMLFLAVFAGFLAENQREHYVEHQRAKIFAASMVNDLASDTAELKEYIKYMAYANGNVDTLIQLLSQNEPKNIQSGKLYWYGLWGGAGRYFIPNDATFQQMKSSGSLRYFTDRSINKAVARYDQLCRKLKVFDEIDLPIYAEVRKLRSQLFEYRYNAVANEIYRSNPDNPDQRRIDSFMLTNPPLLTYDRPVFNQYIEMVRSRFFKNKVRDADSLLIQASELINGLKKEYHLK